MASRTRANGCVRYMATEAHSHLRVAQVVGRWRRCVSRFVSFRRSPQVGNWKVLIADDEPAARRGVRQLLAAFPEFVVCAECRNGAEVLTALDAHAPDVVFLDIHMPGVDGFEVIRRRTPERMPAVVFLTAYDQFAVR